MSRTVQRAILDAAYTMSRLKLPHLANLMLEVLYNDATEVEIRLRNVRKLLMLRRPDGPTDVAVASKLLHLQWAIDDALRFRHRHDRRHPIKE